MARVCACRLPPLLVLLNALWLWLPSLESSHAALDAETRTKSVVSRRAKLQAISAAPTGCAADERELRSASARLVGVNIALSTEP